MKRKEDKIAKEEKARKEFDKELRQCMHCKYFWGKNHGCELKRCYKEKKKQEPKKEETVSKCDGCNYSRNGYCFPCMKDLLGK